MPPPNSQARSQANDHGSDYISEYSISTADNTRLPSARTNIYGEPPQSPGPRQYRAPPWSSHVYPTPLLDRTSSHVSSEPSLHETPPASPFPDISTESEAVVKTPVVKSNRAMTTVSQQERFRKELFRDTAILCEVKGKRYRRPDLDEMLTLQLNASPGLGIEYALRSGDGGTKVAKIVAECQVALVRKREVQSDGSVKLTTSIWGISDDRTIRMQQELTDGDEVIPYTVWGSTEKVSLRVNSRLKFYGTPYAAGPIDTVYTNYTNYVFKDEQGANLFQSAIMGKSLLLSVQTNRTLRVHEGIASTFAYQEQMCALENLRIWKDQDSNGVLAMIHYTPQFRDGYMTFYLNSQRDRVRITDVGDRTVKLKGLNISIEKPGSHRRHHSASATSPSSPGLQPPTSEPNPHSQRIDSGGDGGSGTPGASAAPRGSKPPKKVTGARLEFTTEIDKRMFLEKFREAQGFFYAE
ncbi:MAG: hypothetical protein M1840_008562 [Geoglossum simile]|nr:MAG: hypothetical protein M1840_008562 [Geoglossum simile]